MQIRLICHGQTDADRANDPNSVALTVLGLRQAQQLARDCQEWGIQFLSASTMLCAQQTADAFSDSMPTLLRWDLQEFEDLSVDDLMGEPSASHRLASWSSEQLARGDVRMSTRVMAALARIRLYAKAHGIERVAIIAHKRTLGLLLANWLDLECPNFVMEPAATSQIYLDSEDCAVIDWANRALPSER